MVGVGGATLIRPYVACLMRGDDTKLVAHQHRLLFERQSAAAQLGMHMYGFRVILKNTFATEDLDTVINQLVFRSQGDLQQFVGDRDLYIYVVGEIMTKFNLQQPPSTQAPHDSRTLRPENTVMMVSTNGFVFLGTRAHWTTGQRAVEGSRHVNLGIAPCLVG